MRGEKWRSLMHVPPSFLYICFFSSLLAIFEAHRLGEKLYSLLIYHISVISIPLQLGQMLLLDKAMLVDGFTNLVDKLVYILQTTA